MATEPPTIYEIMVGKAADGLAPVGDAAPVEGR